MAATNTKTKRSHVYEPEVRLAGGYGPRAAKQDDEAQLRRLVLACLLWEDIAYADGASVVENIKRLIPLVPAEVVAALAVEARFEQKLRHVPLLLCREMLRYPTHRGLVGATLAKVIHRPDELCEFVSLYRKDNKDGKRMLPAQAKRGLASAFQKFDEYSLAKWNRDGKDFAIRDVLFLCHAKPKDDDQAALWKRLIDGELATPDTWEVGYSAAKSDDEKRAVWERLLSTDKLGSLAFLKNLRNMDQVGVPHAAVAQACGTMKPSMLLPIDFIRAATAVPKYIREIETLMYRCAAQWPKLGGWTVFVVDVSGSMQAAVSAKSGFARMDAAAAMCVLATEMCERVSIYATAGSDHSRVHATKAVPPYRGFGLSDAILKLKESLGGGGIFTRQCLEFIQKDVKGQTPDRIVVFSDSQDCDLDRSKKPAPFGKRNYIVDVSSNSHGVNYAGVWTAEVSGWSEAFLKFIAGVESPCNQNEGNA
jgi:hypothetical protein